MERRPTTHAKFAIVGQSFAAILTGPDGIVYEIHTDPVTGQLVQTTRNEQDRSLQVSTRPSHSNSRYLIIGRCYPLPRLSFRTCRNPSQYQSHKAVPIPRPVITARFSIQ